MQTKFLITFAVFTAIWCTYVGIILPQELAGQSHPIKVPTAVLGVISLSQHHSTIHVFHIHVLTVVVEPVVNSHSATTKTSTTCSHSHVTMLPLPEAVEIFGLYCCPNHFNWGLEKRNFLTERRNVQNSVPRLHWCSWYSADANESVHLSYQSKWNVRRLLKYLVFSLPLGVVRDQLLFGIVWNGFEISGTRCTSAQAEQQEKRQH